MIRRTHRRWILTFPWILFAGLLSLSCDEGLPPREAPPRILTGTVAIINAADAVVIRNGLPAGTMGAIQVEVTNVYDDVLQDSSLLEGKVEIWLKDHPEVRAEIPLTIDNVLTTNLLFGRILTIGVDTTLVMRRQWSHRTAGGAPFWDFLKLTPGATMDGERFCLSDPATFVIRCSLRVFKSSGQLQVPDREVRLRYKVFGIQC